MQDNNSLTSKKNISGIGLSDDDLYDILSTEDEAQEQPKKERKLTAEQIKESPIMNHAQRFAFYLGIEAGEHSIPKNVLYGVYYHWAKQIAKLDKVQNLRGFTIGMCELLGVEKDQKMYYINRSFTEINDLITHNVGVDKTNFKYKRDVNTKIIQFEKALRLLNIKRGSTYVEIPLLANAIADTLAEKHDVHVRKFKQFKEFLAVKFKTANHIFYKYAMVDEDSLKSIISEEYARAFREKEKKRLRVVYSPFDLMDLFMYKNATNPETVILSYIHVMANAPKPSMKLNKQLLYPYKEDEYEKVETLPIEISCARKKAQLTSKKSLNRLRLLRKIKRKGIRMA
jgi:hypothetical protein